MEQAAHTLWIISSIDMIVVLSGACFGELDVDGDPDASCWTPHPAKANQFRIA